MKKAITMSAFALALMTCGTSFAQSSGYHMYNRFPVGGADRWDYIALSPVSDNIYVAHMDRVNILDKNTGDSTGIIMNTDGVHGIAFAPEFKKGFTSNGRANTVTVFDINSNKFLARIKTGENPDAIMYDPFSKKVFVCDGRSKTLTIIDPYKNEVVKTVDLGGKPETAVSNEAGKIYINIEDKNEIVVVNATNYLVEHRWTIGKGDEPSGLAIDLITKRLFAGCSNKLLIVLDATSGRVVKELPIGDGCDGVAFDRTTKTVFSSNGDGTLTVIKERSAEDIAVIDNVPTKRGTRTLAVDEKTHKVYLPTAEFGTKAEGERRPPAVPGSFQVLVFGK